jgi:glycosyltransferase involved in cell wall biosynthesis
MRLPNVSIIVPIYNVEKYLTANLESIFKADLSDKEILLVDDGSTDNSHFIAEMYQKKYHQQVTLLTKENGGLSSARNYGLERAKGKYVVFFDSDDLIHAEVIDDMRMAADESNADITVADYYEFYDNYMEKRVRYDKALFTTPLVSEEERLLPLFKIDIAFAVWNKMYKRSFLEKNNLFFLPGYFFEDLDFVFRAFYTATNIIKVPKILYGYRQRRGSIMKNTSLMVLHKLRIMDQLADFLKKEDKFEKYKHNYDVLYLKMAFSILYVCFMQRRGGSSVYDIIDEVFTTPYFRRVITRSGLDMRDLTGREKLMYMLSKCRLVNRHTLKLATRVMP